ncbi:hypothetical protein [Burkholderia ubonensis]|uniref:hypothetical protein n=1 Tax=Burkholderia ubonensis TaxID=101571 RepID=UPI0012FAAE20|nr:hypothetical protein [Burkholderia ubonensis]
MAATIDTHAIVKDLIQGEAFTEVQAERISAVLLKLQDDTVTHRDLKDLETGTDHQIALLRGDMNTEFAKLRGEVAAGFAKMGEQVQSSGRDNLKTMVSLLVGGIALNSVLLIGILKFFAH